MRRYSFPVRSGPVAVRQRPGNPHRRSRPSAATTIGRGNGANTSYAYDGDDRLSGITHDFANSADNVAWRFRYGIQ